MKTIKLFLGMLILMSLFALLFADLLPYKVDKEKCFGCRICEKRCPVGAIEIVNKKAVIDVKKCISCGICADVCPFGAVSQFTEVEWKELSAQDTIAIDTVSSEVDTRMIDSISKGLLGKIDSSKVDSSK